MSLRYKFKKARKLLAALTPEEHAELTRICETVRQSQETLLANAGTAMQQCLHNCEGLCCRNARVDDIIGLWDLVYILALRPDLTADMAARVEREAPFYSADCMFLEGDTGPCIFTPSIRPEVCITTFCSGDGTIQKEIRRVKRQFFKLSWFFYWRKPRAAFRMLGRLSKNGGSGATFPGPAPSKGTRVVNHGHTRGEKHD
ncbi:MAG: hypothetical protein QNJ48_07250 [Desulfobacterales bacterium]|nr:hypothetical protein [Desulfobacterales bacterium]MDJ0883940.1 hypothetical protein [Desulfobacterales bacterium]